MRYFSTNKLSGCSCREQPNQNPPLKTRTHSIRELPSPLLTWVVGESPHVHGVLPAQLADARDAAECGCWWDFAPGAKCIGREDGFDFAVPARTAEFRFKAVRFCVKPSWSTVWGRVRLLLMSAEQPLPDHASSGQSFSILGFIFHPL